MSVSRLRPAVEPTVHDAEAALPLSAQPGVVRSLTFWLCLLLAAGGYGAATLAPSYVRNQQLKAETAAADAELQRLVAQVDRYERYCGRLTEENGGRRAAGGEASVLAAASPRPSPPQHVGSIRRADRGGEGAISVARDEAVDPFQQMEVEESLQFQLENVSASGEPAAAPRVPTVIALFGRSRLARGAVRVISALLLLLAFTLCLDTPREPSPPVTPRRAARPTWHPLSWLGMRYRSAESGGHS